jgi:D-amino-acid oxidase
MDVVVVGAGVVGLTAAVVLRERGHRVALWARDDGTATVSGVAAAIWYPFLAEPRARVLGWARVTFRRLERLAGDPASGVRMVPVVEGFATAEPDLWWAGAAGAIERLPAAAVPAGFAAAIRTHVPVCATPIHLPWLLAQVRAAGIAVERRSLASLDEAFAAAPTVVNCTGLGARELCGDGAMVAVRGQVVVAARPPGLDAAWIDDTNERPLYAVPRGDDVVLGGSAQRGDERLAADPADTTAILAGLGARLPELRGVAVRAVKVGLRPWRPAVRLEVEPRGGGRRIVHDYGHGGSGYTLAWGCAEEVADLVGAAR